MSTPSPGHAELTAALSEQWDALARLVADLDEKRWRTPTALPGWTVSDVLAHVIGTESMLLGGTPPHVDTDVRAFTHVRNEIGALNEVEVEARRGRSGAELLAEFREVTDRRRKALAELDFDAWTAPTESPVGRVPYARFMRVRLFDCWMHELDIADALGVTVDEGGPRADLAFAELTPTLGRAVVKKAQALDGSRLTIALTGPVTRQLHIVVNGRAELVDALDGPPTVTLELSSGLFARLRGGRTTPDAHPDEFTVIGDKELGDRLLHNLAFTL
ncbi:maleylpyruvate isomerase family mycothiol-dependent enzyme [Nocardia blacklockiae]|uniref:maleylpyruvate isomerase family mycothiol-dependent enzyme n=1 Tax=Nocardia blacklockiae TaxID=480036 RepID=UPI001893FDE7|nr:maleylpyruvate isomerase family mycothiol-dependent enzyme [Nocardia blacklockiae]MBF6172445.1 maleylpyruvate isomerase family mycothiol-dependent enzyme [Nocardia blacklockiae]